MDISHQVHFNDGESPGSPTIMSSESDLSSLGPTTPSPPSVDHAVRIFDVLSYSHPGALETPDPHLHLHYYPGISGLTPFTPYSIPLPAIPTPAIHYLLKFCRNLSHQPSHWVDLSKRPITNPNVLQPATMPPTSSMIIVYASSPKWAIHIMPSRTESTEPPGYVTVRDVLEGIYFHLGRSITGEDIATASEETRQRISTSRSYRRRRYLFHGFAGLSLVVDDDTLEQRPIGEVWRLHM